VKSERWKTLIAATDVAKAMSVREEARRTQKRAANGREWNLLYAQIGCVLYSSVCASVLYLRFVSFALRLK
jgi:hypothetical protein